MLLPKCHFATMESPRSFDPFAFLHSVWKLPPLPRAVGCVIMNMYISIYMNWFVYLGPTKYSLSLFVYRYTRTLYMYNQNKSIFAFLTFVDPNKQINWGLNKPRGVCSPTFWFWRPPKTLHWTVAKSGDQIKCINLMLFQGYVKNQNEPLFCWWAIDFTKNPDAFQLAILFFLGHGIKPRPN